MGQPDQGPAEQAGRERRVFTLHLFRLGTVTDRWGARDFVALAVATDGDVTTEETTTGMGGDRENNMVEFARLGLELLKKTILDKSGGSATEKT